MAENKKYYYLKLKEDFFDSEDIKVLESMENGYLYSNILLKMYLKSLKHNGGLIFREFIPYDIKMLSTVTGHNIDIVEKALRIFKSLGFIDILDNGTIYMLDVQKYIGSISNEGQRKAEYRQKIKEEKKLLLETNGTLSQDCPNIISISNYNSNSNIYNIREEDENTQYEYLLSLAKEHCSILVERYFNNINQGHIQKAGELIDLIKYIINHYTEQEIIDILKKASKTYIVMPKYSNCDLVWVLNRFEQVKQMQETTLTTTANNTNIQNTKTQHFENQRDNEDIDWDSYLDDIDKIKF